jgi:hypothetical protein
MAHWDWVDNSPQNFSLTVPQSAASKEFFEKIAEFQLVNF